MFDVIVSSRSYVVVMWEIMTLGERPLNWLTDMDVRNYTPGGGKLIIPPWTTKIL